MDAPSVPVAIPMLLGNATRGAHEVVVSGATLRACLDDLLVRLPLLRSHLYEENGELRRHVVILYNDANIRHLSTLDVPTRPGDRIAILQAVSGG